MNSKSIFTTLLFFVFFLTNSVAQSAIGVWKTIDDETGDAKSHVEIYEKNGKLHGKIIKLLIAESTTCDCSGERNGKPLVGMEIMWGMYKSGSTWKGGKIFSPTKDKIYKCKIWLEDDNTLKVRGYYYGLWRTQTWHRVK